jgi:hypothetical protein
MVLPHGCALEKEFNERVALFVATGHVRAEAEQLANDDASLDRYVALAPLCTYSELAPERRAGVQSGALLGAFPAPENPSIGIPPAWAVRTGVDVRSYTQQSREFPSGPSTAFRDDAGIERGAR